MKFKKLNLIACDGYGLQAGKNLIKIQKETVIINFSYDVLYILNEKGDIICTLLPDNAVYESEANRDRRYQNNQNGFDINWDEENEMCTVTCIARKNGSTIAKKIKGFFGKQAETIKATAEYLHDTPDDLLEKENLKNEQDDDPRWEAAQSAHTIEAYTQYLNIYDVMPPRYRGRHVNEAIAAKSVLEHIQSQNPLEKEIVEPVDEEIEEEYVTPVEIQAQNPDLHILFSTADEYVADDDDEIEPLIPRKNITFSGFDFINLYATYCNENNEYMSEPVCDNNIDLMKSSKYIIVDDNDNIVCDVFNDENEYTQDYVDFNEQNGFTVNYFGDTVYVTRNAKPVRVSVKILGYALIILFIIGILISNL